jgi:hypothetical protein
MEPGVPQEKEATTELAENLAPEAMHDPAAGKVTNQTEPESAPSERTESMFATANHIVPQAQTARFPAGNDSLTRRILTDNSQLITIGACET